MTPKFFFDASAIIRVVQGEDEFAPYANQSIVTERGHVFEFTRHLVKTVGARGARESLSRLRAARVEPTDEDLVEAAKLVTRSTSLSAQDALGYVLARRERLVFLTTDRAFRNMPGAEVVDVA